MRDVGASPARLPSESDAEAHAPDPRGRAVDQVGIELGADREAADREPVPDAQAHRELRAAFVTRSDPEGSFVRQLGFVPTEELPSHLASADLFVFASSCENMPNTLVEAMAVAR